MDLSLWSTENYDDSQPASREDPSPALRSMTWHTALYLREPDGARVACQGQAGTTSSWALDCGKCALVHALLRTGLLRTAHTSARGLLSGSAEHSSHLRVNRRQPRLDRTRRAWLLRSCLRFRDTTPQHGAFPSVPSTLLACRPSPPNPALPRCTHPALRNHTRLASTLPFLHPIYPRHTQPASACHTPALAALLGPIRLWGRDPSLVYKGRHPASSRPPWTAKTPTGAP